MPVWTTADGGSGSVAVPGTPVVDVVGPAVVDPVIVLTVVDEALTDECCASLDADPVDESHADTIPTRSSAAKVAKEPLLQVFTVRAIEASP